VSVPRADVLIGSELTYSFLSIDTLVKVIDTYLSKDGVFYEILSDDRDVRPPPPPSMILISPTFLDKSSFYFLVISMDALSELTKGVAEFVSAIQAAGFDCAAGPPPPRFLGSYGTGQREETYKFWTFWRRGGAAVVPLHEMEGGGPSAQLPSDF
jgi:hypothetical protein